MAAMQPTNIMAPTNERRLDDKADDDGRNDAAKLPMKLKTPPARPTEWAGATSPTVLQTMAAMP